MYLNSSSDSNLLAQEVLVNDAPLRNALYGDLDRCWKKYEGAARTKSLYVSWEQSVINLDMSSKIGTSFLHGAACGSGVLKCDMLKIGVKACQKCRKGCSVLETLEHIILECPHYKNCYSRLVRECQKLKLKVTVQNAMCHPALHVLTERFFKVLSEKVN